MLEIPAYLTIRLLLSKTGSATPHSNPTKTYSPYRKRLVLLLKKERKKELKQTQKLKGLAKFVVIQKYS